MSPDSVEEQPQALGLETFLKDALTGEFNLLVIWSFASLNRACCHDAAETLAWLGAAGCDFVSYSEEMLNSLSPFRWILVQLLEVLANSASPRATSRCPTRSARTEHNSRRRGRPRRVYPLQSAELAKLRAAGLSWSQIAERTGIPATSLRRLAKIAPEENG